MIAGRNAAIRRFILTENVSKPFCTRPTENSDYISKQAIRSNKSRMNPGPNPISMW